MKKPFRTCSQAAPSAIRPCSMSCMVLGLDFDELKHFWNDDGAPPNYHFATIRVRGSSNDHAGSVTGLHGRIHPRRRRSFYRPLSDDPSGLHDSGDDHRIPHGHHLGSPSWPSLLFEERNRPDAPYSHRGRLHVPPTSSFIHLVSAHQGRDAHDRRVTAGSVEICAGSSRRWPRMRRAIAPASAPIIYQKLDDPDGPRYGEVLNPVVTPMPPIIRTTAPGNQRRILQPRRTVDPRRISQNLSIAYKLSAQTLRTINLSEIIIDPCSRPGKCHFYA